MKETFTITAFSENHIGLLNRVTIIFSRRQVNIETLTVGPSAMKKVHKFTITVKEEREKVEKIVKQIDKLVEVIKAFYHTDDEIIYQEIALYKVATDLLLNSNKIENLIRKSGARIVEVTPVYTVVEKMGSAEETQELFDELKKIGILQFTRSGRIAVTRLSEELLHNYLKEKKIWDLDD